MKREILNQIVKHFTDLYADEINADEVTDDVIHEWWGYTRDQYGYDTEGGGETKCILRLKGLSGKQYVRYETRHFEKI